MVLRQVEKRCFDIPTVHLYDLVVGTSIGGQIALAIGTATQSTPLTVAAAADKFKTLMKDGFVRKIIGPFFVAALLLDKSKFKTKPVEAQLKNLFGKEAKMYGPAPSGLPNVAVTTVPLDTTLRAHLVTN
jgi:patatin-like phospholipase/acyl hydrolase